MKTAYRKPNKVVRVSTFLERVAMPESVPMAGLASGKTPSILRIQRFSKQSQRPMAKGRTLNHSQ